MSSFNATEITAYNISVEEAYSYLEALQYEKVIINIPTCVFLSLMFILGIAGNSLIIRVFTRDQKKTTTSIFILSIAILDLISTLITIPVTMYVNLRSLFMKEVIVCKIYFFVNFFNGFLSVCLLLAVAFVSWQVEKHHAHKINAASVTFSLCVTTPHIIVHGRQTTETGIPGVQAHQCRIDDAYMGTQRPTIFMGAVNCIFFVFCVLFTYMYVKIWLQARRRSKRGHSSTHFNAKGVAPNVWIFNTGTETTKQRPKSRTTLMLFTTTIIYVITNFSTIMLMLARALNNKLILNLGPVEASLYSLFFNMYLFNCAMNPILYSLSNKKFREKCWDIFRRKQ